MKYYEVDFRIVAPAELMGDVRDVISALAGEAGFETFEETEWGLKGYVQRALFSQDVLEEQISYLPFEEVKVSFEVNEAEDRDWNEQWEQEGFDPIVVGRECVVHDGRHLQGITLADYPVRVEIDAHLAFGTGTHETTRMMISSLLETEVKDLRVLDCGCGTGILGIVALKLGASEAVGYDIDEWSADNARHNAVINGVDDRFSSLLGDASLLNKEVEGLFGVVLANINRNILLADMPAFRQKMMAGGTLLLSGFYESDIPMLAARAQELGLQLQGKKIDGEWACLSFILASA
ncbi:MAG: 50S ribosomal protein L11 methyltransferase [Prevotella sp.]|nr:50S ribosomal protein L11 methyltransferase [Prevotella sp.]